MAKILRNRFIQGSLALAQTALLVACGGGGGSGSDTTTPPVQQPVQPVQPVVTITTGLTSTSGNTPLVIQRDQSTAQVTLNWVVTNGTTLTLRNGAGATVASGASGPATVNVPLGTSTYQLYNGSTPLGSVVTVTASCVGNTTADTTGTCRAPTQTAWWPPANITPIGTRVTNPNRLAANVVKIGDAGWQAAVRDGTVKFFDTGLVHTGYSDRKVNVAYFIGPSSGNYCTRFVYADTGLAVGAETSESFAFADGSCNTGVQDFAVGTLRGVIRSFTTPVKDCYEVTWTGAATGYSDQLVACPN